MKRTIHYRRICALKKGNTLSPEPQFSQHQILIIVWAKTATLKFPKFQAGWGRDVMRRNLGLFSFWLPTERQGKSKT